MAMLLASVKPAAPDAAFAKWRATQSNVSSLPTKLDGQHPGPLTRGWIRPPTLHLTPGPPKYNDGAIQARDERSWRIRPTATLPAPLDGRLHRVLRSRPVGRRPQEISDMA